MQGERRLARRGHMRYVGDPMMRPITKYEFPLCPCLVRSLVRLSLFLNRLLDMFMIRYFPEYHKPYEYFSTGISSEYVVFEREAREFQSFHTFMRISIERFHFF